jgi:toxin-antitoxin system PIN domain toxin
METQLGPWLLDVNILLAWLWPKHPYHEDALHWLGQHLQQGWATCPFTETGFLRIVSSPAFSPQAPGLPEALSVLQFQMRPELGHEFWSADLGTASTEPTYLKLASGHQQVTDAYLLALAVKNRGCLVTRDRRMKALAPDGSPEQKSLLVLP